MAVTIRNAPNRKNTQVKREIMAAPMRMNTPRNTNAMVIPMDSTNFCSCFGTAKFDMMMTKTNRLSILSEYSVSQPE